MKLSKGSKIAVAVLVLCCSLAARARGADGAPDGLALLHLSDRALNRSQGFAPAAQWKPAGALTAALARDPGPGPLAWQAGPTLPPVTVLAQEYAATDDGTSPLADVQMYGGIAALIGMAVGAGFVIGSNEGDSVSGLQREYVPAAGILVGAVLGSLIGLIIS